jgi:hypothetical protein
MACALLGLFACDASSHALPTNVRLAGSDGAGSGGQVAGSAGCVAAGGGKGGIQNNICGSGGDVAAIGGAGVPDAGTGQAPVLGDPNGPAACEAAGGRCLLGGAGTLRCLRTGNQDCNPMRNPGGAFCCLEELVCDDDAGVSSIAASDYDQSCATDSDCVAIGAGDACQPCGLQCTNSAINKAAEATYRNDRDKLTPSGVKTTCHCPLEVAPCCLGGQCRADLQCQSSRP